MWPDYAVSMKIPPWKMNLYIETYNEEVDSGTLCQQWPKENWNNHFHFQSRPDQGKYYPIWVAVPSDKVSTSPQKHNTP